MNTREEWLEPTIDFIDVFNPTPLILYVWKRHLKYLRKVLPTDEELRRRWWRRRFRAFVHRMLRKYGYSPHPYNEWGTDEYILGVYPWMRPLWIQDQQRLTIFMPLIETLRKSWWTQKRLKFGYRNGILDRKERVLRHVNLAQIIERLVWCEHRECWAFRLNVVIVVIVLSILLYYLY